MWTPAIALVNFSAVSYQQMLPFFLWSALSHFLFNILIFASFFTYAARLMMMAITAWDPFIICWEESAFIVFMSETVVTASDFEKTINDICMINRIRNLL